MGHVHLRVADVEESIRFYRDVVGFDLMAQLGDQAAFLSAGGYHHRLGANTWESRGAPPAPRAPRDSGTSRSWSRTGDRTWGVAEAVGGELHDPSGNAFALRVAA